MYSSLVAHKLLISCIHDYLITSLVNCLIFMLKINFCGVKLIFCSFIQSTKPFLMVDGYNIYICMSAWSVSSVYSTTRYRESQVSLAVVIDWTFTLRGLDIYGHFSNSLCAKCSWLVSTTKLFNSKIFLTYSNPCASSFSKKRNTTPFFLHTYSHGRREETGLPWSQWEMFVSSCFILSFWGLPRASMMQSDWS